MNFSLLLFMNFLKLENFYPKNNEYSSKFKIYSFLNKIKIILFYLFQKF